MKVLKNNYNNVVYSVIEPYPREIECENCSSELQYDKSDLEVGVCGVMHVKCPLCGY